MPSRPWYPWWPGDYLNDTYHLTLEQDGFYRRLLDAYWKRQGPLPDSVSEIAKLTRISTRKCRSLWSLVDEFFTRENGQIRNKRMDEEIAQAVDRSKKARTAAGARWSADAMPSQSERNARGDANAYARTMPPQSQPHSSYRTRSNGSNVAPEKRPRAHRAFREPSPEEQAEQARQDREAWKRDLEAKGYVLNDDGTVSKREDQ